MGIPPEDLTELVIKLRDHDNQLVQLIEYIRILAGPGHSFIVDVDPEMREHKKTFSMDGDGSFFIKDIKMNGKKVEVKDGKLIENYLQRIQ
jgi:hypothetical protein